MRIKISHETTFEYAPASRGIIQNLRLTPRSFDSQYVLRWRVAADIDGALRHSEDSLGNVVHSLSYPKAVERLTVTAIGEVETSDAIGVVRGSVETLPASMYLRASALAHGNRALREFAADATAGVTDPLARLHLLMNGLHKDMTFEPDNTNWRRPAAEAFALKKGGAPDFAHAFIACAHHFEIPARYVSGYIISEEQAATRGMFAWAEAYSPGLGWVAFDAVHDLCANADYVRVAIGFDALSAAPFRGSHVGVGDEKIATQIRVEQARGQGQS